MHVLELSQYVITIRVHGTLVRPCRTLIFDVCVTIYNLPGVCHSPSCSSPSPWMVVTTMAAVEVVVMVTL